MQSHPYRFLDPSNIVQYLVVPESEHFESSVTQPFRANRVRIRIQRMLSAINFDYQHRLKACEVENIIFERMLPPEFESAQVTAFQATPQSEFRVSHAATEFALRFILQQFLVGLAFHIDAMRSF